MHHGHERGARRGGPLATTAVAEPVTLAGDTVIEGDRAGVAEVLVERDIALGTRFFSDVEGGGDLAGVAFWDPHVRDVALDVIGNASDHPAGSGGVLPAGRYRVFLLTDDGVPLYDRQLTVAEVQRRIERCWRPYHAAVAQAIDAAHARHGWSIHLNCHSMPAVAASHATLYPGAAHADFVIGDRDGSTASPRLTEHLAAFLRGRGYSVDVNHPYKGVELVRRYGRPDQGRHSIQLEINRKLYMDEQTLQLLPASERLRQDLRAMAQELLRLGPAQLA